MKQVKRMPENQSTKIALLDSAQQLFAQQGFDGTSVRDIATQADANLGAVTYHFGTKLELYHAVIDRVSQPIRDRLSTPVPITGSALDGIETFFRATFAFLGETPDIPRLILQQLVTQRPLPPAAQATLRMNLARICELIKAGQKDGTIRDGDPPLMALSFLGTPLFLAIYRRALKETIDFDQDDPETRRLLTDTIVTFVRSGLAAEGCQ
jgi:AcrR family transcriptional regulator